MNHITYDELKAMHSKAVEEFMDVIRDDIESKLLGNVIPFDPNERLAFFLRTMANQKVAQEMAAEKKGRDSTSINQHHIYPESKPS